MEKALNYRDITQKITGCAMKVHSKMRSGYNELIDSGCLQIEFDKEGSNL